MELLCHIGNARFDITKRAEFWFVIRAEPSRGLQSDTTLFFTAGSFHLVYLFLNEYVFYLVEQVRFYRCGPDPMRQSIDRSTPQRVANLKSLELLKQSE
jgi:hypothetical protein